jgi:hypothetical protein
VGLLYDSVQKGANFDPASGAAKAKIFVVQTQAEERHESLRFFTLGDRFSACMLRIDQNKYILLCQFQKDGTNFIL